MLSKKEIKLYSTLKQKKFRDKTGLFLVEGIKLYEVAIKKPQLIERIIISNKLEIPVPPGLKSKSVYVKDEIIDRISSQKNPEGVIVIMKKFCYDKLEGDKIVVLYKPNDPGNVGTIFRVASWFNLSGIILVKPCVDIFNPKVIRATMGAFLSIPFIEVAEDKLQELLPEKFVAIADMVGDNLYNVNLNDFKYIIFGNETHGVRDLRGNYKKIAIPQFNSNMESLNLATSVAIFSYEWRRNG